MTLRRRLARLESRAPDRQRARIAAMSDDALQAEYKRLAALNAPVWKRFGGDLEVALEGLDAEAAGLS